MVYVRCLALPFVSSISGKWTTMITVSVDRFGTISSLGNAFVEVECVPERYGDSALTTWVISGGLNGEDLKGNARGSVLKPADTTHNHRQAIDGCHVTHSYLDPTCEIIDHTRRSKKALTRQGAVTEQTTGNDKGSLFRNKTTEFQDTYTTIPKLPSKIVRRSHDECDLGL
ncbi:hypothetical protein Bbelb_359070 [Branchiostoma belcheri]|nr:hypothetical protein Bbelb_359070 [Branchiostoma belcheri]